METVRVEDSMNALKAENPLNILDTVPMPTQNDPQTEIEVTEDVAQKVAKPLAAAARTVPLSLFHKTFKSQIFKAAPARIYFLDLPIIPLPKDRFKAHIVAGDLNTKFFSLCVSSEENFEYIVSIADAIENHVKSCKCSSYSPQSNEMCLAKYQGKYHRAHCYEVYEESVKVRFIDFGSVEIIQKTDLKPFDKSLMFDVRVQLVLLDNVPSIENLSEEVAETMNGEFIIVENVTEVPGEIIFTAQVVGI
jgi:Tudor domain